MIDNQNEFLSGNVERIEQTEHNADEYYEDFLKKKLISEMSITDMKNLKGYTENTIIQRLKRFLKQTMKHPYDKD